jgi:hypothetical protein
MDRPVPRQPAKLLHQSLAVPRRAVTQASEECSQEISPRCNRPFRLTDSAGDDGVVADFCACFHLEKKPCSLPSKPIDTLCEMH